MKGVLRGLKGVLKAESHNPGFQAGQMRKPKIKKSEFDWVKGEAEAKRDPEIDWL